MTDGIGLLQTVIVSSLALTAGPPLLVEQDAIDGGPDENAPARLLNDGDHVEGKFTGTPARIVGAALVVVEKERVDEEAGVFWRDT